VTAVDARTDVEASLESEARILAALTELELA
jgi:hypothetical protein